MEIQKKLYGENHPYYARMLVYLGKLYAETEQKQFALEILQKVVAIEEETLGEENDRYKSDLKILARVSYTIGNYELSMQCWEKVYNMNFGYIQ